jgi:hypothetical protein
MTARDFEASERKSWGFSLFRRVPFPLGYMIEWMIVTGFEPAMLVSPFKWMLLEAPRGVEPRMLVRTAGCPDKSGRETVLVVLRPIYGWLSCRCSRGPNFPHFKVVGLPLASPRFQGTWGLNPASFLYTGQGTRLEEIDTRQTISITRL